MSIDWEKEIKELEGWHFGGKGSGLEGSLVNLVVQGIKTATCSWHKAYEIENKPIPRVGERSFILSSTDNPTCVIELFSSKRIN